MKQEILPSSREILRLVKKPGRLKTLHYVFRMEIKPGAHQLPAQDDGWKIFHATPILVSHLYHILFLFWSAIKKKTKKLFLQVLQDFIQHTN